MAVRKMLVTTAQLQKLVEAGVDVHLPEVAPVAEDMARQFPDADYARARLGRSHGLATAVRSVSLSHREEVACIRLAGPGHVYLTSAFIPTHNTSNIIFLKSTDDSMLDTLQKMSGTTHRVYGDSKTVTRDNTRLAMATEGKVSITMSAKEEPVISFNDLASLPMRNSIVFRAGDPVIWNRNETILPMSWRLFRDSTVEPGKEKYTLQTVPTLSSAREFDVRQNQPDFSAMLEKRIKQAVNAERAREIHIGAHNLSDLDIQRSDPDMLSNDVMDIVDMLISYEEYVSKHGQPPATDAEYDEMEEMGYYEDDHEPPSINEFMEDSDQEFHTQQAAQEYDEEGLTKMRYAASSVSREMLVSRNGPIDKLDGVLALAFDESKYAIEKDKTALSMTDEGGLRKGETIFIRVRNEREDMDALDEAAQDMDSRVFTEGDISQARVESAQARYEVTDEFKRYLVSLDSWRDIGDGDFERAVASAMSA